MFGVEGKILIAEENAEWSVVNMLAHVYAQRGLIRPTRIVGISIFFTSSAVDCSMMKVSEY